MSSKTFNVAVIGYGLSAKVFHIPFIQQDSSLKLYGILQRNPSPSSDASKDHPGLKTWRTPEELLSDPAVDLVIITTPVASHVSLATASLNAGKHVVVEKPFTETEKEARELAALAKKKGLVLSVYQNRRWDADFVTVRHLIQSGKLGRVVELETHVDRYVPDKKDAWQERAGPGVGMIYDAGSHILDQIVHGLGLGLPERVSAIVGTQRLGADQSDSDDSFTALLQYENGPLVTAKGMVLSAEEEQLRFWVRGDKGSFRKFHLDVQEEHLLQGKKVGAADFGVEAERRHGLLTTVKDGKPSKETFETLKPPTWSEYYRLLAKALAGEGENPVTADQAADVIGLIESIKQSSATGRTVKL